MKAHSSGHVERNPAVIVQTVLIRGIHALHWLMTYTLARTQRHHHARCFAAGSCARLYPLGRRWHCSAKVRYARLVVYSYAILERAVPVEPIIGVDIAM